MKYDFFNVRLFDSSAWSFVFFIPTTTANDLRLWRISIPDFIHNIYFPILLLEKEPVFTFSMLSAKQGHYWYHFYNVFGMTRSLTGELKPGSPALDDSTLPLGYRGGGIIIEVVLQAGTYLMSIGYTSSTTHLVCSLIGNVIYSRVSAYSNVVCTFQK